MVVSAFIKSAGMLFGYLSVYMIFNITNLTQRKIRLKHSELFFSVLGIMIFTVCRRYNPDILIEILWEIVYLTITAAFLYTDKILTIISLVNYYVLLNFCLKGFVFSFFSVYKRGQDTFRNLIEGAGFRGSIVCLFFEFFCFMILYHIQYVYHCNRLDMKFNLGQGILSYFGLWALNDLINLTQKAFNPSMPGMWFFALAVLCLFVYSFIYENIENETKHRFELLQMHNEMLEEKYDELNSVYRKNARLYHDLNNHLNILYQLLNLKQFNEAKEYIQEISNPVLSLNQKSWTDINVIDVVLNSKLQKIEEMDIAADINVDYPVKCNLAPNDLALVLANLLDNAIEASEKEQENRIISLKIKSAHFFLFIRIDNPCSNQIFFSEGIPHSTKNDKDRHGWGILGVEDIIKKYNGASQYKLENNVFSVIVMIPFEIT